MIETNPISKIERRAILATALAFLIFVLFFIAADALPTYVDPFFTMADAQINLAVDGASRIPGFHLITLPIALALIRPRRFFLSTSLTLVYVALLILSLYLRADGESFLGGPIPGDQGLIEEILLKASNWDYVAAFYLLIMIPWQVSLVRRANRRAIELP